MPQGQKAQEFKLEKGLDALISLNISHLHDAANFFALLKNQIDAGEDLNQIKKFSRGAAYHFRSLFEELRASKELLNESNIGLNTIQHLERYYSKEIVDLKDLLELEILQLDSRLQFKDRSESTTALTEANFGLLSKLVVNLVENALKYSQQAVTLELKDLGKAWELRISSLGVSIPEGITNDLESSPGHGLSATADIMRFHNAEINIHSLTNEGSCIILKFKKLHQTNKVFDYKVAQITKSKVQLLIRSLIILGLLFVIFFNTKNSNIEDTAKQRLEQVNAKQAELYRRELVKIKEQYLNKANFTLTTSDLASYAILIALPNKHSSSTWHKEAEKILQKIPEAYDLHLGLASYYYNRHQYSNAIPELILGLYHSVINHNPELKIAQSIIASQGPEYYLASLKEPLIKSPAIKTIKTTAPQPQQTTKINQSTDFDALNQLIEEQNQDLGINLDL